VPIYKAEPGSGVDFDGTTANRGEFLPTNNTGSPAIQIRVNSISFSGPSAITDWTLSRFDPADGQEIVLLTDTTVDMATGGPHGFDLLPTDSDGNAGWGYKFVTNGITGAGVLKIDYDFMLTEG